MAAATARRLVTWALIAAACSSGAAGGKTVTVNSSSGEAVKVGVELATTPESRAFGLMYRQELGTNAGMLFVFPQKEPQQFWMHNTQIPLDILYIRDDGKVARIYARTTPMSDTPLPSGEPVRFVLEVKGGFCADRSIKVGDTVDLGDLARAPAS